MAQLKDSIITGSLRVTDTIYTSILQASSTINGLTLTPATTGFTIAGGTTSKTLTVSGTATINAPTQWGIVYGGASGAYTSTAAGSSGQYLKSNGSAAPTWATFSASTVGLGNVENTKLSTWTGSENITTVGTLSAGTVPWSLLSNVPALPTGNARIFYGTCSIAARTAAKTVTCAAYDALTAGDVVIVKFDNANTASTPTLNVNSKGAKNIKKLYNGAINNLTANGEVRGTCIFVYDGTQWILTNADYNDTYSSETAASGGTNVSLVTTGEKYTWNNKAAGDHTHGSITNAGKIGTTNNLVVTSSGLVSAGAAISAAISSQTTSTKFLREDGTWSAPSYLTIGTTSSTAMAGNTEVNNVTQNYSVENNVYPLLMSATAGRVSTESRGNTTTVLSNEIYANPLNGVIYSKYIYLKNAVYIYNDTVSPSIGLDALNFSTTENSTVYHLGLEFRVNCSDGLHGIRSHGYYDGTNFNHNIKWMLYRAQDGEAHTELKIYGAVWNDYAEYRKTNEQAKPGNVVIDNDDGSLALSTKRLQPGAQIVTDTFGFAIGKTETTKTPLAVSGRVLAYTYQSRENYHAGQAVCSAPNGTIDIMTREEIQQYPDCIIGIVSEIPNYEVWGEDKVSVNNRIWIKIK